MRFFSTQGEVSSPIAPPGNALSKPLFQVKPSRAMLNLYLQSQSLQGIGRRVVATIIDDGLRVREHLTHGANNDGQRARCT
jgi:hypothetical protein